MGAPYRSLHLAVANAATANRFVTSTNMANGAYTLANTTMPTDGARFITITTVAVTGADTMGTVTVVGTNLQGETISEVITPLTGATATGTQWFATVTSATQAGWVINGGNDTITIGCNNRIVALDSGGFLHAVNVNTTAAGTITLADSLGTIAILKTSVAEGAYIYDVICSGFLEVTLGAASDVTVSAQPA